MKKPPRIQWFLCLVAGLFLVLPLGAQVPKKQPLGRYSELWTKSAFTIPPLKEVVEIEEENPLEEYTLAGACEVEGGWFVVLINKTVLAYGETSEVFTPENLALTFGGVSPNLLTGPSTNHDST